MKKLIMFFFLASNLLYGQARQEYRERSPQSSRRREDRRNRENTRRRTPSSRQDRRPDVNRRPLPPVYPPPPPPREPMSRGNHHHHRTWRPNQSMHRDRSRAYEMIAIVKLFKDIIIDGSNRIYTGPGDHFRPHGQDIRNNGSIYFEGSASSNNSHIENYGLLIVEDTTLFNSSIVNCGVLYISSDYALNNVAIDTCNDRNFYDSRYIPATYIRPRDFDFNQISVYNENLIRNHLQNYNNYRDKFMVVY